MSSCNSPTDWSASSLIPSADNVNASTDVEFGLYAPRPGWPCFGLAAEPPSVMDRQAAPNADDIVSQIAGVLTPRGPAWGTDEVGDGTGASPVQRLVWKALAAWVADLNCRDFELATQVFPSAITFSLPDWERELGLPDDCFSSGSGTPTRIAAVRARFSAIGGQSPAYFVCLARAIGYEITIEEPTQFMIDVSEVSEEDPSDDDLEILEEVSDETVWKYWVVRVGSVSETWFHVDDSELSADSIVNGVLQPEGTGDRLEGFSAAEDLECLMNRYAPQHTRLVFNYSGA